MRTTSLLLAACCLSLPIAAQTASPTPPPSKQAVAENASSTEASKASAVVTRMMAVNKVEAGSVDLVAFDSRARSLRGSPFLVPSWTTGEVVVSNSAKPVAGVLKYDVLNQELYVLRPKGDSIVLAADKVQAFKLHFKNANGQVTERAFERLPHALAPRSPTSYAEVIAAAPNLQLLKVHSKTLLKGQTVASYGNTTPVDVFQNTQQYFLRWADGACVPVNPNKTSVLNAIAERQASAVQEEWKNKAKARTDAELATLVLRVDAAMAHK